MMTFQFFGVFAIAISVIVVVVSICLYYYQKKQLEERYAHIIQDFKRAETDLYIKNEFIKNLANELREPLNPITGFSDILTSENLLPEERKLMSEQIKESSKVVAGLIDKMAELSFYECKKSLPVNVSVSLNEFCQHMIDSYKDNCKQGVELRFDTTIPDEVEIQTNFEALKRLIELLMVSAIKYTEEGNITLACSQQEQKILISVSDTGRGIPEIEKKDFFDYILHHKVGADTKQTAMSLAICQSIVRLLGGRIWLDTACSNATRFVCELPAPASHVK